MTRFSNAWRTYDASKKQSAKSTLEELFAGQLTQAGIAYYRQFQFDSTRRWRADFFIPGQGIVVEVQGGTYMGKTIHCEKCGAPVVHRLKDGRVRPIRIGGGHNRGKQLEADYEKHNTAVCAGFRVFLVTEGQVKSGAALGWVRQAIGTR